MEDSITQNFLPYDDPIENDVPFSEWLWDFLGTETNIQDLNIPPLPTESTRNNFMPHFSWCDISLDFTDISGQSNTSGYSTELEQTDQPWYDTHSTSLLATPDDLGVPLWEPAMYHRSAPVQPTEENIPVALQTPLPVSYACPDCPRPKTFSKRSDLNRHRLQHTKPVHCPRPSCNHRTAKTRDMDRHVKARHPDLGQPVKRAMCPVEGCKSSVKGFGRKDNLTKHMKRFH